MINIAKRITVPVRVMNPFKESKTVYQDTVLGTGEAIEEVMTLVDDVSKSGVRKITESKVAVDGQLPIRSEIKVPNHLEDLYKSSSELLSQAERQILKEQLIYYQDVFSKDEWDIGNTNLTEHEIHTGKKQTFKQPPRSPNCSCW